MLLSDYKNDAIVRKAKSLTKDATSTKEKIQRIFLFVRDSILFQFPKEGDLLTASKTLAKGYGQCNNKSNLFLALCKAAGIPSRIHFSLISKDIQKGFFTGIPFLLMPDEVSHSWIEVELDGQWMKIDGYINDKGLHKAAIKKLEELDWHVGFSVANKNKEANIDLDFDHENFVQMGAVTESHGVYDDPMDYYQTDLYKNRPGFVKLLLYKLVINKINNRVKNLRSTYIPNSKQVREKEILPKV